MNEKRAEAKKAYDRLTPDQQAELDEALVRKLTDEPGPNFTEGTGNSLLAIPALNMIK